MKNAYTFIVKLVVFVPRYRGKNIQTSSTYRWAEIYTRLRLITCTLIRLFALLHFVNHFADIITKHLRALHNEIALNNLEAHANTYLKYLEALPLKRLL